MNSTSFYSPVPLTTSLGPSVFLSTSNGICKCFQLLKSCSITSNSQSTSTQYISPSKQNNTPFSSLHLNSFPVHELCSTTNNFALVLQGKCCVLAAMANNSIVHVSLFLPNSLALDRFQLIAPNRRPVWLKSENIKIKIQGGVGVQLSSCSTSLILGEQSNALF